MPKIIESKKIVDVLNHADQKTLVIFDIDNTLVETVQEFGSLAWHANMTKKLRSKGTEYFQAMQKTCAAFAEIENLVSFKTIEPETLEVVKTLNQQNIPNMVLTKRMFSTKRSVVKQLRSTGLEFSQNTIHDKEIKFTELRGFAEGILYSGLGDDKGECLLSLFEKINYTAEKILFIDDERHHVEEFYKTLNAKGIDTTCIRYDGADERVAKFNPAKADQELLAVISQERFNNIFKELL